MGKTENVMKRRNFIKSLTLGGIGLVSLSFTSVEKTSDVLYYKTDQPIGYATIKEDDVEFSQPFVVSTTLYKRSFSQYIKENKDLYHIIVYDWWIEDLLDSKGRYNGNVVIRSALLPKNRTYHYEFNNLKPIYKL